MTLAWTRNGHGIPKAAGEQRFSLILHWVPGPFRGGRCADRPQRAWPGDRSLGLLFSVVRTSPAAPLGPLPFLLMTWGRAQLGTRLLAFTLADS